MSEQQIVDFDFDYVTKKEIDILRIALAAGQGDFTQHDIFDVAEKLKDLRIDQALFDNIFAGMCVIRFNDNNKLEFRIVREEERNAIDAAYSLVDPEGEFLAIRRRIVATLYED